MARKAGAWIESRRCLVCNELKYNGRKKTFETNPDTKAGFMKDPNNEGKWIPCMNCNDKGFTTKTGTIAN